jgi:AraC family transcriptional regulator
VIDYIQAHLNDPLSLASMAAQIDMSRCHFATQFKQATGVTPHQYVSEQRVENAKRLLRSDQLSIAEIALMCGFANQSHLNKVFKKYVGTTPKVYQNNQ